MRYLMSFWLGFALAAGLWLGSGWRGVSSPAAFADLAAVESWMAHYHLKPEPERIAQAIDALVALGALDAEARLQPAAAFLAALIGEGEKPGHAFQRQDRRGGAGQTAPPRPGYCAVGPAPMAPAADVPHASRPGARAGDRNAIGRARHAGHPVAPLRRGRRGLGHGRGALHATGSEAAALRLLAALAGSLDESDPVASRPVTRPRPRWSCALPATRG